VIERHRPLLWLAGREVLRVLKLWSQTIVAPVIASFLFILVFGLSLGGRIKQIDGFSYDVFIVPGLITMAMVQAAYTNNASSVFQARFDRYLHDVLAAPMRTWEVNLGLSMGGAVRSLAIGVSLLVLSLVVVDVPINEPGVLILAVIFTGNRIRIASPQTARTSAHAADTDGPRVCQLLHDLRSGDFEFGWIDLPTVTRGYVA